MKNIMGRLSSIVLMSVFFLVVSGMAEIEVGCLLGFNGNAVYAAKNTKKKVVKKKANKKKEVAKKHAKSVSDDDYEVPQEWQWFNEPLKLGSIFTNNNQVEEKKSIEKPATFAMALEKMQEIKSKRSKKDFQSLANIKSEAKSPSMLKMQAKVKEIKNKADIKKTNNKVTIDVPIVIPSFVSVPSPLKIDSNSETETCYKNNAYEQLVKAKKEADLAKQEANELKSVESNITPKMSQDELNKIVTIDDLVAVENEPPAIQKGNIIVERVEDFSEIQNKKHDEDAAKKEERFYYGVGNKYSDRINQILAERKNKVLKVKNDKSEN